MSIVIAALAMAGAFLCPQPSAIDGDTIRCRPKGERLRLAAIDAPDRSTNPRCRPRPKPGAICDTALAARSRAHLDAMMRRRPVRCEVVDASPDRRGFQSTDRYGRKVVRCNAGGRDLSRAQLRAGMAVAWPPRP